MMMEGCLLLPFQTYHGLISASSQKRLVQEVTSKQLQMNPPGYTAPHLVYSL